MESSAAKIVATLECRDCSSAVSFASSFEPNDGTEIDDTQYHMDKQFVARCSHCFACNWEVTDVKRVVGEYTHGWNHNPTTPCNSFVQ